VPASHCNGRLFTPACEQRFQGHILIGEKSAELDGSWPDHPPPLAASTNWRA